MKAEAEVIGGRAPKERKAGSPMKLKKLKKVNSSLKPLEGVALPTP